VAVALRHETHLLVAVYANNATGADFWHTAELERFNVPRVRCSDGPNGIRGTRFFGGVSAACIPCGTALGATWDRELLYRAGELLGRECISKGAHCWLGPTVNIQRSPMGGRGFESYSEDPHLSGILAVNIVMGVESTGVQATPKHFVCNDQEHERRAVNTIIPERALREVYLRPFQILARDAAPGVLMTSYNKINGLHVAHDPRIINGIVREEWGWDPLVMSDWHGTYSTTEAVNAGMDLEMPGGPKMRGRLGDFVQSSRLIKQSVLDQRARRVLQFVKRAAKVEMKEGPRDLPEDRALNREIAGKSIVVLKNDSNLLPLPAKAKKVALIGSHMRLPVITGGGSAVLNPYYTVTLSEALSERYSASGTEIAHEVGVPAYRMLPQLSKLIQRPDRSAQGGIMSFYNSPPGTPDRKLVVEEHFQRAYCQLMDYKHPDLNFDLFYITAEAIFTPDESGTWDFGLSVYGTANVYLDDELIIDETTEKQKAGGAFFGKGTPEKIGSKDLEEGKEYKLRVEFGSSATSTSPQIGVTTFGGGGFQLGAARRVDPAVSIDRACKLAQDADYAILCTGLNAEWECEGTDRIMYNLPPRIDELISRVLAAQPKTVIVTQAGTPFAMPWQKEAQTIVHAWYGGNEAGNGIADVLFGDVNPSARLPLSWPATEKENPAYLNWGSTQGRVMYGEDVFVGYKFYDEMERPPMFAFGHGLSYTAFEIKPLAVSKEGEKVSVEVKNTGKVDGTETVQVYVHAKSSLIRRPKRELHGFSKAVVPAGKTIKIDIGIDKYAASLWDEAEERWMREKGEYEVLVGSSSREEDLTVAGSFTIEETSWWLGL
jgi:beta-glucosidase